MCLLCIFCPYICIYDRTISRVIALIKTFILVNVLMAPMEQKIKIKNKNNKPLVVSAPVIHPDVSFI